MIINCCLIQVQWNLNNGKCGICGDDFGSPSPRSMENTGMYGKGKVAKLYKQGETIEVSVLITANHLGYFQFSLCDLKGKEHLPETEECFKVLPLQDGSDIYMLPSSDVGYYKAMVQLPKNGTCSSCVLRWHYNTGKYGKVNQ